MHEDEATVRAQAEHERRIARDIQVSSRPRADSLRLLAHCRMPADVIHIAAFQALAVACAQWFGIAPDRAADIELAVEEVLANIINHAYPEAPGDVVLRCLAGPDRLVLEVADRGIPFDALAVPDPRLSADITEREIGGLGIYLVKQVMDQVEYRREEDSNVLRLVVMRSPSSSPPS